MIIIYYALQAFVWASKRAAPHGLMASEDLDFDFAEVLPEAQKSVVLGFSDYNSAAAGRWKG